METWSSYSLEDLLLFAPETYFRLFQLYNAWLWPAQLLLVGVIPLLLWLAWSGRARALCGLFALAWAWAGWAFLHERYATINWAADWFAAGFAVQAAFLVLAACGVLSLEARRRFAGLLLLAYSLLLFPFVGLVSGRSWGQVETFAVLPDPTAVATLSLFLLTVGWGRWALLPIPLAWIAIATATGWILSWPGGWVPLATSGLLFILALLVQALAGRFRSERA